MNAVVQKELRMMLPAWSAACVLAGAQTLLPGQFIESGGIPAIGFTAAMVLLGLTPFGREFQTGCFSALLAQPAARQRT
ncbi:MAG: hypothetical protein ACP5MD_06020 [Verrucomicrobiia bacterium]